MSRAREKFRSVLSGSTCALAASIFDHLSARIAHMLGYKSVYCLAPWVKCEAGSEVVIW
jgi:2-methylisocitrate lyase-like PEP mutase family enzyme